MCKQGIFLSYGTEVTFKIFEIPFTGKWKVSRISLQYGNKAGRQLFMWKKMLWGGHRQFDIGSPPYNTAYGNF